MNGFTKKTYKKIDASYFQRTLSPFSKQKEGKKIVATQSIKGLREEMKRLFLPLLIEVFECRQTEKKSEEEILQKLTRTKDSVLDTMRWCEGVLQQIEKGIEECKNRS